MRDVLIVVDMQKDFVDGALGTAEAQAIVPAVAALAQGWQGPVLFTRDTHGEDYLSTQEGRNLPVPHCLRGSDGWQIVPPLRALAERCPVFDKPAFGSPALAAHLAAMHREEPLGSITLAGLCTGICVISNALLVKAALPEVPVRVRADCCACVTPQSHQTALAAMRLCQIEIL